MLATLLSLPGQMKTLLSRLTSTRASNLDNLDAPISGVSAVNSIQNVSGSMNGAALSSPTDVTIAAVNTAKTFIAAASSGGGPTAKATLLNATTVRITFNAGTFTGSATWGYSFFVVELK
jgi:hypothetical protein